MLAESSVSQNFNDGNIVNLTNKLMLEFDTKVTSKYEEKQKEERISEIQNQLAQLLQGSSNGSNYLPDKEM